MCEWIPFRVYALPHGSFVALWYTKHEMGLRMAIYFGFAAIAGYVQILRFSTRIIHLTGLSKCLWWPYCLRHPDRTHSYRKLAAIVHC